MGFALDEAADLADEVAVGVTGVGQELGRELLLAGLVAGVHLVKGMPDAKQLEGGVQGVEHAGQVVVAKPKVLQAREK